MAKRDKPGAEIFQDVDETTETLDDLKLESLQHHMQLQLLNQEAMKLESKRLAAKYGENHARVLKIKQRMGFNEELFPALDMQLDLTMRAKEERFDPATWQLQGFVFDVHLRRIEGLQISLLPGRTANEKEDKQSWQTLTDHSGFYSISLGKEAINQLNGRELQIQVIEGKEVVYRSETALAPAVGQMDVENITIERIRKGKKESKK